MMGEVVYDSDSVDLGFHLEPPLDAAEGCERLGDRCWRNAVIGSQRRGGSRVPDVVFAGERELEIGPRLAISQH